MTGFTSPELTLNDGRTIPQLGYGVWQVKDEIAEDVVQQAFAAGYRHIDTARIYGNEAGVGRAIAASGLDPRDLFITTKVWNSDQGYRETLAAFEGSLGRLGLETLDLFLIHWLYPRKNRYVDTWKALVELQQSGRVRSIGVCNFTVEALREIEEATGVVPGVHQVETHPYFPQAELRAYEASRGIRHESWSPLGQGGTLLSEPVLAAVAAKHGATPAQAAIAWHLALGNVVIPKTVTPERIVENWAALGVSLDEDDLEAIDGLDKGPAGRIGPDPVSFDVP